MAYSLYILAYEMISILTMTFLLQKRLAKQSRSQHKVNVQIDGREQ